ncbi:MAG: aspartate carbamoyltransferase catalytic subunit [Clostridia bacterium]|jgi:aspartate carbamoyltransferase catalytic subunit|nr:aspartate carbamoyltransferase catalytic subunit [Clostridia bacterium]MDN5322460.1 aspartate carbamoyltransferase catalytic subunit [Clostridia bacterium]
MGINSKDLISLSDLSIQEIHEIFTNAKSMKEIINREIKKVPTLRGKAIINLFYENSTRTRSSFELAGKYMGADVINISASSSSVAKGESLRDTAKTIESMGADVVVMRHPASGAHHILAQAVKARVINAGDGTHEHPTQALLDIFTILEHKGTIRGKKVAIIGDILHSRVARSNIWGLNALGADVWICGPPTLMPSQVDKLGVNVTWDIQKALKDADVVMMLRIQLERQKSGLFPSIREYSKLFGLNKNKLKLAKEDALVMHPGPMNRGVEITADVAESYQSVIEEQVTNGVAIRMALLYAMGGGKINASA